MMFLDNMPKPFFILAPMDDVTETAFRRLVASCAAPDVFFTEFVNVDGLQSPGRPTLLKKLKFTNDERPLIVQLWGKNPDNFYKTARELADGTFARELGMPEGINFASIDLNMGCPDKTVVKNGTCSALINNRELAQQIIMATKDGANGMLPVSIKTRLGFSGIDLSWPEFLLRQDISMLTIHGRTRKEMSKVPAHWDEIGRVRALRDSIAPDTKIVGNGDVETRQQGLELAKRYGLDGIMIGRGVFHDPFVFAVASPWQSYTKEQRLALFARHLQLFQSAWQYDERSIVQLYKFSKVYMNGFEGAKELREQFTGMQSLEEMLAFLAPYVA